MAQCKVNDPSKAHKRPSSGPAFFYMLTWGCSSTSFPGGRPSDDLTRRQEALKDASIRVCLFALSICVWASTLSHTNATNGRSNRKTRARERALQRHKLWSTERLRINTTDTLTTIRSHIQQLRTGCYDTLNKNVFCHVKQSSKNDKLS